MGYRETETNRVIYNISHTSIINISCTTTTASIHTTKDYAYSNTVNTTICNIIHPNTVNTKYTTTCCYQFCYPSHKQTNKEHMYRNTSILNHIQTSTIQLHTHI